MTAEPEAPARRGAPHQGPEPPAEHARFAYAPALDGLRAVAVAAVFAYHAGIRRLAGGFLGVDAFFVISGFLITTLLVREWGSTGGIALRSFWARRVRRLLSALLLLLLGISAYGVLLAPRISRHSLRLDGLATLFYVANWRFVWSHQSYFEAAAGPSPLRHTWSLAVEEQWYLVWPLAVTAALAVLARRARSRGAAAAAAGPRTGLMALGAGALAVASAAWMAVLTPSAGDTSRAYFGTDTRAQGLLVGAAVAFALHRWPLQRRGSRVAAWLGAAGLVAGVALFLAVDERTRWLYHGGFLLAAAAWAAVVVATVGPAVGPVRRLLAVGPLVALGRISYGVYLWLWPSVVVLTPSRVGLRGWPLVGVQAVATVGAATVSYVVVERPVRAGRWRGRPWWRPAPLGAGAIAVTALVVVACTVGGTAVPGGGVVAAGGGGVSHVTLVPQATAAPEGLAPPAGVPSPAPVPPGRRVSVAVVGDSVGFAMVWYAPPIAGVHLSTRAIPGCGVIPVEQQIGDVRRLASDKCPHWLDEWKAAVASRPDVALVFLGGWEVFDPWVDGRRLAVGSEPWRRYVAGQLERGIAALTVPPLTRVGLVTVPCYRYGQPVLGIPSGERNDPQRTEAVNELLRSVAARHPGRVTIVDYASLACPAGRYRDKVDGVVLRPDGMHTDATSTRVAWQWLAPIVLEMAHRPEL